MSLLVGLAAISGEGGRAPEKGSSAMVVGRCHRNSTGAPVEPVQK